MKMWAIMNMSPLVITQKGKVVGLGKVAITKDLSISNVLLVESVSFNLLSIAQLCDLGLICTFSDNEVVVTSKEDKCKDHRGVRP